jgi:hypothetical protein
VLLLNPWQLQGEPDIADRDAPLPH